MRKAVIDALGTVAASGLDSKQIVTALLGCLDDDDLAIRLAAGSTLVASASVLPSAGLAAPTSRVE